MKRSAFIQKDLNSVKIKVYPSHCKKCHHSWWPNKYDFRRSAPVESKHCPLCKNEEWQSEHYKKDGFAPRPEEANMYWCICPVCSEEERVEKRVLLRERWIKQHRKNCDFASGQEDFLPKVIGKSRDDLNNQQKTKGKKKAPKK